MGEGGELLFYHMKQGIAHTENIIGRRHGHIEEPVDEVIAKRADVLQVFLDDKLHQGKIVDIRQFQDRLDSAQDLVCEDPRGVVVQTVGDGGLSTFFNPIPCCSAFSFVVR